MLTFQEFLKILPNSLTSNEDINEFVSFILDKNYNIVPNTVLNVQEGIISGTLPRSSKSKESDWNKFYRGTNRVNLLRDNLGGSRYKLYQVVGIYFLTDFEDNYIGFINLSITNRIARIKESSSNLSGGFYKIMFPVLLSLGSFDNIVSDANISMNAYKSYERLNKNGLLSVSIVTKDGNIPISLENYLMDPINVIEVREKHKGYISEHFSEYTLRLNEMHPIHPVTGKLYLNKDDDNRFFCDTFYEYFEYSK